MMHNIGSRTMELSGEPSLKLRLRHVLLIALLAGSTVPLVGQALYGSIVGTVLDSSGAAIPGATVTATQAETNEVRSAQSNESGGYTLSTVPTGTYRVQIQGTGFTPFLTENVTVRLNTEVRVDANLRVGGGTETVNVVADQVLLQTDRSDVRHELTNQSLEELPQPTRTYQGLIALMPGVAPPVTNAGGTNNAMRSMQIQANGTSASGTNVRVDGVSATNPWVQYYSTAVPSTDAIQTVSVVTGSADADQGMVNGAAVNVQIKTGSNKLHGSVYEYHIDNVFKARPYFLPTANRLAKLIDNDLGGTVGGPILRDRLFFFGSYEGDFLHQGNINIATVPTAAIRAGDLSGSANPIYNPATGAPDGTGRTPFPNNQLGGSISPISQKILALVPLPNLPGIANNYYVNTPQYYKLQRIDTKFQWNTTPKLNMFVRVSDYFYNVTQGTVFGPILGGGNNAFQDGNIYAVSASATYVATPHFVVDALFGLTHSLSNLQPPQANQKYGAETLGIPGTNVGILPQSGGVPQFNFSNGFSNYGYAYPALTYNDPVFQYTGNATWTRGQHNIRFGFDISQQHMNHQEVTPTAFGFTGGVTSLNGGPAANLYNTYADFLLGLPQNDSASVLTVPVVTLRTFQYSPYVSDQWNVSPKLTISLGTRWDYYPVPRRADRGVEIFDLDAKQYKICGKGATPIDCGISVQKTLFSPRFGVAFRPTSTTVARAGFSLVPEQINMYRDGLYNYPLTLTSNYTGTSSYTAATTLAVGIPVLPSIDISSGAVTLPPGATFSSAPKNFIRGYTESGNVTVQQDFGSGWIGSLAYVGTHTIHQHTRYNINYGQVGGGAASQPFNNGTYGVGTTGGENVIYPLESSHYNSMQATLQHQFAHNYQMGVAYTWSQWFGICCDANGDGSPNIPIPQYFYLNRALMPGDRTHNLRISSLAASPFGSGKSFLASGPAGTLLGGWQMNMILSFYSGSPFSVTSSGNSLNAPGSTQPADQVKSSVAILHGHGSQPYFDPKAFAPVTAVRFGNARFDSLRGPGFANVDLGLFRDFRVHEAVTLQGRVEVLNATNTPHFSNPSGNVSAANYDTTTSTSPGSRTTDERYVRFGFKARF